MSKRLISILRNQNVYLPEFNYPSSITKIEGYNQVKKLINLGFLSGGYTNDFQFEKQAKNINLCTLIMNGLKRSGDEVYKASLTNLNSVKNFYSETEALTGATAARICNAMMEDYVEKTSGEMLNESFSANDRSLLYVAREKEKIINALIAYEEEKLGRNLTESEKAEFEEKMTEREKEILERFDEENKARVKKIEEDVWKIVKENGYFTEDFDKDDVLTRREVYVTAVDILEKYMGRELGA